MFRSPADPRTPGRVNLRLLLAAAGVLLAVGLAPAAELRFLRSKNRLELVNAKGETVGRFEARNNVVTDRDPFPAGTFTFSHYKTHDDDAPNSAYGSHGIFVFDVPKRTGMGVHSGRAEAKRNPGPKHPTHGCIRTTDDAMKKILDLHQSGDKIKRIVVKD